MNKEEKEAIEWLKRIVTLNKKDGIENTYAEIVLNLIEKQSKEIEELKAISEYRKKIIKGLGLKTLPKTITGFKELVEKNDKKWEDKIKAKIGERMQKNNNIIHNAKLKYGKDYYWYDDVQEANRENDIYKDVLNSLLEKE